MGELAYQLGGPAAYAQVAESEKFKAAVGTDLFENLIGDQPTLIMIDEIARHLRAAMAVPTATGKSNLADQTVAFLMSLLEFASSKQRCLVVLTLAGESDAFAAETELLRKKLAETLQGSARQERVLTPAAAGEIYAIVTHRLFKKVDYGAAKETYDAYMAYYAALDGKGADLPRRCLRAEYAAEMAAAYPFHPELVMALNRNNPPLARLQVLGNGASLTGSGRLSIGDEGAGELFVTAGGQLTSAEARIGGLLATGVGVADVGGNGSLWETGNIAVGYGSKGSLPRRIPSRGMDT